MKLLENHYRDMCDIEFTIEQGRLFILQTRVGKRTAAAALRMAVEMAGRGAHRQAGSRAARAARAARPAAAPAVRPEGDYDVLAKGLNASPGAAVGKVYFTADDAEARAEAGEQVILVRPETSPDDLHGMIAAEGILTSRGGLVSHAAVVARGMGKPAICGADALKIDLRAKEFAVGDTVVHEGDVISISGTTGEIVLGEVPVVTPEPTGPLRASSSAGPTSCARSRSAPTPTCPRTRPRRASSARRASACAAPSTCSSATGCRSCSA